MGKKWIGAALSFVALSTMAGASLARINGQTGSSGLQGSGICNTCHQGGTAPVVSLEGPSALDAGVQATIVFRMQTDAAITGMNAAASDGIVEGDPDGGKTRSQGGEVVHAYTVVPSDGGDGGGDAGEVVYSFSFTAPEFGGAVMIYAAGNAANNNDGTDGDLAAGTKLEVVINGPPKPVIEASAPPPPPPFDSGTDAGLKAVPPEEDDGGCSVHTLGGGGTSALGAAAAIVAVLSARRFLRRRSRATRS